MSKKQLTLRLPKQMHSAWKRDSKAQGITVNTFIISCVQRDRATFDRTKDPVNLECLLESMSRIADSMERMGKRFDDIQNNLAQKSYASIDLERAKESMMSIILDGANSGDLTHIQSHDALKQYVTSKNALLERYMIPSLECPRTLLDEILLELSSRKLLSLDSDGTITWGDDNGKTQ